MSDVLTDRHKKYAAIALAVGTLFSFIAAVIGFWVIGFLFGGGSILVAFMFFDKSLAEESEVKRRVWITMCIIAIVGGLLCFVFAVVGLYAHQLGWL